MSNAQQTRTVEFLIALAANIKGLKLDIREGCCRFTNSVLISRQLIAFGWKAKDKDGKIWVKGADWVLYMSATTIRLKAELQTPAQKLIKKNRIALNGFNVICDIEIYDMDPGYVYDVAPLFDDCKSIAEARKLLRSVNNDGTWTVKASASAKKAKAPALTESQALKQWAGELRRAGHKLSGCELAELWANSPASAPYLAARAA